MDSKNLLGAAQEPACSPGQRGYCCVPVQPAGFVNKARGFLLTSGPLQEPCCALVTLKLVAFHMLFGIREFSRMFSFAKENVAVSVCAVKLSQRESCRMNFLSQDMCDCIPFLSHCWPPSGVTQHFVTILYVLLVPLLIPGHPEQ